MSRIAIIGAGPIGLEAALLATQLGHDVQVFEKGRVAENVLDWGHVRLFSPFGMNASDWGSAALRETHGDAFLPHDDELLRGREFADRYLLPLSRLPELAGRIHEQCQVVSISRRHFAKTAGIGSAKRAAAPFQLLVEQHTVTRSSEPSEEVAELIRKSKRSEETPRDRNSTQVFFRMEHVEDHIDERIELADIVLDCSGTYPNHNWLGDGGLPCHGERDFLTADHYRLPVITEEEFANRIVLVVGSGFSAATSVVSLAGLALLHPQTKVLWIANTQPGCAASAGPLPRIPDDPLTERDRLAAKANDLAIRGHIANADSPELRQHPVVWFADAIVTEIVPTHTCRDFNGFDVDLIWPQGASTMTSGKDLPPKITVDRIIANVGYRPDRSIYEELHVHECYATQGPIKLAAKLLGEMSSDCLSQTNHGCDVLKNPEANFFILGAKSYGRNSNFLLKVGIEQVREVLRSLT